MTTARMLTYNVMFGKRIDRIIDWLNRLPDYEILCFQEFPKSRISECIRLLGRRPYGWKFTPSLSRRKVVFGELTLYRTDLLQLVSTSVISLGINKVERSILKTAVPRSSLVTKFRMRGQTFSVANVHIVALAANALKFLQVNTIATALRTRKEPTIIVGDFNISSLAGKKKLVTILNEFGYASQKKRLATHRVGIFRHQFDYVFAREVKVDEIWSYRLRLSDHFPVHVKIRLPQSG